MQSDAHKDNVSNVKFIPFLLPGIYWDSYCDTRHLPHSLASSTASGTLSVAQFEIKPSEDQISQKLEPKFMVARAGSARGISRLVRLEPNARAEPSSFSARGEH